MKSKTHAAKHTHTDNGGAARDWKILSDHPPLRGAIAFPDIPLNHESGELLIV